MTISVVAGREQNNLIRCLRSLRNAIRELPCRLIVTDNGASWDVEKTVRAEFPDAEIIRNPKPRGFGQNHNQAALNRQDDYVLILNDDIEIEKSAISNLIQFADQTPNGALFGPLLCSGAWDGKLMPAGGPCADFLPKPILGAGSLLLRFVLGPRAVHFFFERRYAYVRKKNEKRGYISGACCLVRRSFIQKHGLYDERFYMYYEDIDLGRRARENGYECWQAGEARILHLGAGSFSEKTAFWFAASSLEFARKYHGKFVYLAAAFLILIFKILFHLKGKIRGAISQKHS